MNSKRTFIAFLILFLFLCGCGSSDSDVSTETSATISELSDISKAVETEMEKVDTQETHISKEEAIQAVLDYSPEGVTEPDEDAEKDIDYYVSAAQDIYGLPYWKAFGIASLALDIIPSVSEEEVVSFIDRGEHVGFESLFEGFFWDRYSDEKTIEYAKAYAYYLTEYVLDSHSFTEFMSDNYREEWLKANGSKSDFTYETTDALLDTAKSEYDDGCYALSIGDNVWICGNESWIHDASDLYDTICYGEEHFVLVREAMEEDAPIWYENIGKKHLNVKIILYDDEKKSYTETTRGRREIYLRDANDVPHEYVHALVLGSNLPWFDGWISEGLAVRYSLEYQADGMDVFDEFSEIFNATDIRDYLEENRPYTSVSMTEYYIDVQEKYEKLKSQYDDRYSDNLYSAVAIGQQELEDGCTLPGYAISELLGRPGSAETFSYAANHLSYFGAAMTTDLLIKECGADKVLSFMYAAGDFATDFGFTQQEFLERIKEEGCCEDTFIFVK